MSISKCIWIDNGGLATKMGLSLNNTLVFGENKQKVDIEYKKFGSEIYLLFTWQKTTGRYPSHIFKCPDNPRFEDGMEIEWCDVEIPGIKNHKKTRSRKRVIKIIDSSWFNKLWTNFENEE